MRRLGLLAVVVLLLASCGGQKSQSPASIVRAWSHALNTGDNEGAAKLFAKDARIIQGTNRYSFHTLADAIKWNAHLPCAGRLVGLEFNGGEATATFELYGRKTSECDAPPGARASAIFKVEHGKIVRWEQIAALPYSGPTV